MRNFINLVEGAQLQHILVIVHPGSACGSADFNLGSAAFSERDFLTNDIANWSGGVIVIDSELGVELALPKYRHLSNAIDAAVSRAKSKGLIAIRRQGNDPAQVRVIRQIVKKLSLQPHNVGFEITGAWFHSLDGGGCVGSVHNALKNLGFRVVVRDSALNLDEE